MVMTGLIVSVVGMLKFQSSRRSPEPQPSAVTASAVAVPIDTINGISKLDEREISPTAERVHPCRARRELLCFAAGMWKFSRSHHAAEQQPYAKYQNGEFTKQAERQGQQIHHIRCGYPARLSPACGLDRWYAGLGSSEEIDQKLHNLKQYYQH